MTSNAAQEKYRPYRTFHQTCQAEGSHLMAFIVRQADYKTHSVAHRSTDTVTQSLHSFEFSNTCSRWPICCLQDGLATATTIYRLMPQDDLPDKIRISFICNHTTRSGETLAAPKLDSWVACNSFLFHAPRRHNFS